MQRKELGIAVIGCGRIGSLRAKLAAEHPAVHFLAVADRDPGRARALADKVGAQFWSGDNFEAMARPEVNAIVVSTIEVEHYEPLMRAFALGKPILVEKPLALALAAADRLIAAARSAGCDLRVAYSRRFKKRYLLAKEQIVQGRLGRITGGAARVYNSRSQAMQTLSRLPKDGPSLSGLVYYIDALNWMLEGNPPVEVYARGQANRIRESGYAKPDLIWAIVTLADGAILNLGECYALPHHYPALGHAARVELIGSDGVMILVPIEAGEQHLVGARLLEEAREADAVVRGSRLLAEGDDLKTALRVELGEALAELPADHAVADHDDRLVSSAARFAVRSWGGRAIRLRVLLAQAIGEAEHGDQLRRLRPHEERTWGDLVDADPVLAERELHGAPERDDAELAECRAEAAGTAAHARDLPQAIELRWGAEDRGVELRAQQQIVELESRLVGGGGLREHAHRRALLLEQLQQAQVRAEGGDADHSPAEVEVVEHTRHALEGRERGRHVGPEACLAQRGGRLRPVRQLPDGLQGFEHVLLALELSGVLDDQAHTLRREQHDVVEATLVEVHDPALQRPRGSPHDLQREAHRLPTFLPNQASGDI
jgi:predicted dehydrogenase